MADDLRSEIGPSARAKVDPTKTLASMSKAERQIRFGIAWGLTRTAKEAQAALSTEAGRVFAGPTPTTLKAFFIRPALREDLRAEVFAKDWLPKGTPPAKYLKAEVFGGQRRQKRSERALAHAGAMGNKGYWVPARGAPLNAYGNLPGALFTRMLSQLKASSDPMQNETAGSQARKGKRRRGPKGRFFVPKPGSRLPPGVYERQPGQRGIKAILIFVASATYRRRLDFFGVVERVVRQRKDHNLAQGMRIALQRAFRS